MLNIRKYLAELMGVQQISDEDIRKELDELRLDNQVEDLTRNGHIAADPQIQMLARKAVAGGAMPEEIIKLLTSQKPIPAQTHLITPPSGPAASGDTAEAAIRAEMNRTGTAYHDAAKAACAGATLMSVGDPNTAALDAGSNEGGE